jgi:riboflavin-specific deaminase-like protein
MFVFSNLATSIDGKIATSSRVFFPLGTPEDRKHMQVLRRKSDIVLFGASTLREFKRPCIVRGKAAEGLKKQPANAIVSSALDGIDPTWPFFQSDEFHRILFVTSAAKKSTLKKFEDRSEIVVLKKPTKKASTAHQIIQALEKRGYKKLLVEGGGGVMWDFAQENWIDEYHLTLTPRVVGGTQAPTLVDGAGFEPADVVNLKLKSLRKVKDELYLVYSKTPQRG